VTRFSPVSPQRLVADLSAHVLSLQLAHPIRVALDGARCARLGEVAEPLCERLRTAGRPSQVIAASSFYRDASLRLEYGKTDLESFYSGWLDDGALQRELLGPLADPAGPGASYLPALRDPVTNRSVRATPVPIEDTTVAIVVGELLLGKGLDFDLTVHASMSRAALRRRTEPEWQWTLPAFDRYDIDVDPSAVADVVLRYDDPGHPAIRVP
jgi:hypothetical protein